MVFTILYYYCIYLFDWCYVVTHQHTLILKQKKKNHSNQHHHFPANQHKLAFWEVKKKKSLGKCFLLCFVLSFPKIEMMLAKNQLFGLHFEMEKCLNISLLEYGCLQCINTQCNIHQIVLLGKWFALGFHGAPLPLDTSTLVTFICLESPQSYAIINNIQSVLTCLHLI